MVLYWFNDGELVGSKASLSREDKLSKLSKEAKMTVFQRYEFWKQEKFCRYCLDSNGSPPTGTVNSIPAHFYNGEPIEICIDAVLDELKRLREWQRKVREVCAFVPQKRADGTEYFLAIPRA
jgi:hypothetical protein